MKWIKKLTAVLGLVLVLCAAVACGGNSAYTVTVDCDSLIMGGIQVELVDENGVVDTKDIGKDGKVAFDVEGGTYEARIVCKAGLEGLLDDYVCEIKTLTEKERSVTLHVTPKSDLDDENTIDYNVTVQLPDGTPVKNITVQLCGGPDYACYSSKTNDSGLAALKLKAGEYEVHIASSFHPAGYTFDDSQYKMNAEGGSLTVQFKKA